MKLAAHVEDFPPEQDSIHLANGTLLLDGTFTEGKPDIVRSRLPVSYLIQESAIDYYNKEADVIEENKKDGMSSMEWNSERGTTVIGYIKAPEGSTLPDYTLMITCTAPTHSDS